MANYGSSSTQSASYTLAIALSSYIDPTTGYTVSGTIDLSFTQSPVGGNGTISATSLVLSSNNGGPVTSSSWNNVGVTSYTDGSTPPTFTGTVTNNGTVAQANQMQLGNALEVSQAAQAAIEGIQTLMNAQGSGWTSGGGTINYSPNGMLNLSGNSNTVSGTTTDSFTVTFTSYAASNGYTVSGPAELHVVSPSSGPGTGTLAGTLTFGNGPITSATFALTGTGNGSTTSFTGTVTVNSGSNFAANQAFDATTFGLQIN